MRSKVEKAKQNGLATVFLGDAQTFELPPPIPDAEDLSVVLPKSFDWKFDAVFSNAALHWCKHDPLAVVRNTARVLRKGGRFVGEMGGYMNTVGQCAVALFPFRIQMMQRAHRCKKRNSYGDAETWL